MHRLRLHMSQLHLISTVLIFLDPPCFADSTLCSLSLSPPQLPPVPLQPCAPTPSAARSSEPSPPHSSQQEEWRRDQSSHRQSDEEGRRVERVVTLRLGQRL